MKQLIPTLKECCENDSLLSQILLLFAAKHRRRVGASCPSCQLYSPAPHRHATPRHGTTRIPRVVTNFSSPKARGGSVRFGGGAGRSEQVAQLLRWEGHVLYPAARTTAGPGAPLAAWTLHFRPFKLCLLCPTSSTHNTSRLSGFETPQHGALDIDIGALFNRFGVVYRWGPNTLHGNDPSIFCVQVGCERGHLTSYSLAPTGRCLPWDSFRVFVYKERGLLNSSSPRNFGRSRSSCAKGKVNYSGHEDAWKDSSLLEHGFYLL